ncbi:three-Cys-motif partner protein TcmP [bacterium]|nr:three-Cys-motif partner protein TcmP [bacterium]
MPDLPFRFDEIGFWSEDKLRILQDYSKEYSTILHAQKKQGREFRHYYIDAFSGAGIHISRNTGEQVKGSPLNALSVEPPFTGYFFIDSDSEKTDYLRDAIGNRMDVKIFNGDCNTHLIQDIFPQIRYENYQRALCFLDPYGLHLDWKIMEIAGRSKVIEIFLNFPIQDMNRNVLRRDTGAVDDEQRARMNKFWGDESWKEAAYRKEIDMFKFEMAEKESNDAVAQAFRKRLNKIAGFKFVPNPLPMRNSKNAVVYYLFFASNNATGETIAKAIFKKYQKIMDEQIRTSYGN